MILEEFAIVHCYGADDVVSAVVDKVRAKCLESSPKAKKPKLGNHTTSFPPILAPKDEMRHHTLGLRSQDARVGDVCVERNRAEVDKLDFFRNPDVDALILRVILSPQYIDFIRFWREHMEKFTKWRFPPLGEDYNPHICIAEEKGLFENLAPHMWELNSLVSPVSFYLPSPRVMMKIGEGRDAYWEDFDPLKGL